MLAPEGRAYALKRLKRSRTRRLMGEYVGNSTVDHGTVQPLKPPGVVALSETEIVLMNMFPRARAVIAAAALAGLLATPVMAQEARIRFHGGSVAFIAGVNWGDGSVTYKGKSYPIKVGGLNVGAVGATKYSGSGEVFHLRHLHDLEGTYSALDASATAGGGGGDLQMHNDKGVEIHMRSSSAGLKLSFAPSGVSIKFK